MIVERSKVLAAYERARELGDDHDKACAAVAQALGLQAELVSYAVWQGDEVAS